MGLHKDDAMSQTDTSLDQIEDELFNELSDEALERASWVGFDGPAASCQRTDTSGSIGCGNACC
jgi:hypothetical protein